MKNINPEKLLRNAKQEFSCQSLESFSGEYYRSIQITVWEASKTKQKSSVTHGVHQNGATVKNVKRYQPVKNACAVTKFRQLRHFI